MVVIAVGVAVLASGALAPSAEAVIRRPERQLARLVNNYREDHGENRLRHKANLHRVAEKTSKQSAERNTVLHTNLNAVPCDGRVGEVAGKGATVRDAFRHLKASGAHRSIMLRPYWNKMGVGVARSDNGITYVTVIFCD